MSNFIRVALGVGALWGAGGLPACCPARFGELRGNWVYVGSAGGAGIAAAPWRGGPLELERGAAPCVSSEQLDQHFGDACEEHETEGGAQPDAALAPDAGGVDPALLTGDIPLGNNPTPREVRWYCDRQIVVRVVLERCDATTFRATQLAVSTRRGE
jgi:hypothetical protein